MDINNRTEPKKNTKLTFTNFVLHNSLSFRIVMLISSISALITCGLLCLFAWYFNWDGIFKILITIIFILSIKNLFKMLKYGQDINMTIYEFIFKKGGK